VPIKEVRAWEEQFLRFVHERQPEIVNGIRKERKLTKEIEQQLTAAITNFQAQFRPAGAAPTPRSDAIKAAQDQIKTGR
jgi:F0F1-type ATP synthase alpha subunit